jgi:hypothetical protein
MVVYSAWHYFEFISRYSARNLAQMLATTRKVRLVVIAIISEGKENDPSIPTCIGVN